MFGDVLHPVTAWFVKFILQLWHLTWECEVLRRCLHHSLLMVGRQRCWQTSSSEPKTPENRLQSDTKHAVLLLHSDRWSLIVRFEIFFVKVDQRDTGWKLDTGHCTRMWGVGMLRLHATNCHQRWSLPSSWLLRSLPLMSWEGQKKSLSTSDIPRNPLLDGAAPAGFGLMWTLKQHRPAKTSQGRSSLRVRLCGRTGSDRDGLSGGWRWGGAWRKKTRGWGQLLGKGNLHSKFSLTVAYKAACMCGSSLERTEIMTLSDIPVKISCLAHLPVIS